MPEQKFNNKEEFEKIIIEKCWKDEEFKNKLLKNPNKTLFEEFNTEFNNVNIRIIETEPNEIIIGIPPAPNNDIELTPESLDAVSGGAFAGRYPTFETSICVCSLHVGCNDG